MNFTKISTHWYSTHKRELPWRGTRSPYYIWLSEIIMQQTQIKQGLPYYKDFVSNFPTVFDLAKAQEKDVLKLWQGLGYYSRARHLHYSAKYIVNSLHGEFPKTYKELLKLKGVGDYTASAIASICYNEPTAVVDGNVYRVLSRYFGIDTPINSSQGIKVFKKLAQNLLPKDNIGDYNQAIMEFGAIQCKPKKPNCNVCPLNKKCVALLLNRITELPVKINKTKISKKYFNFLVFISENNKTILEQRVGKGIWQNLYQFPLIETKKSLTEENFKSNTDVKSIINGNKYNFSLYNDTEIVHKLSHQHLYTKFWIVKIEGLPQKGLDISKIKTLPVPAIISRFLNEFNF
ncbi:MAG: A/G-specific adenine glycosylase [Flavobacteriaceae bacterium]|nr:A/G-specific adenine glycosylase [Flavobacteriaceae bacterium]